MPSASRSCGPSRTASSARRLYRLNLGVGAVGAGVLLVAVAVALRAISLAPPSPSAWLAACRRLLPSAPSPAALLVLALAVLGLVVAVRAARSALRQRRQQRRFLRDLRVVAEAEVCGSSVLLIDEPRPQAFCAGCLRPRLYLSIAALERLSEAELRAVLAHERHHLLRRDPLRVLVARVLSESLFFLPILPRLSARYAALAELAADEATVHHTNDRRALASALLSFGESGSPAIVVGIAPERVDHLLGERPRWELPASLVLGSLVAIAALTALALTTAAAVNGASLNLPMLIAETCTILMAALPVAMGTGAWLLSKSLLSRASRR